ncbi:hypothetical protein C8R47DRAFT_126751 [Mycena vitilis]|nr:hypothetical protein C8R47DRAFT_126751 [Mycena vitilis]
MADKITRIAIVDANRCKPKRCAQECKKVRSNLVVLIGSRNVLRPSHVPSSKWVSGARIASKELTDIVPPGKLCIEVKSTDKIAYLSEFLCIGCGICVKKSGYRTFRGLQSLTRMQVSL